MKLRDKQEKVERTLILYKFLIPKEFEDQVLGLVLIDARLTFETIIREKDTLVAEFIASEKGQSYTWGGPLSLAKLFHAAHVSDCTFGQVVWQLSGNYPFWVCTLGALVLPIGVEKYTPTIDNQKHLIGGWIETKNSNASCLQWAVTMSGTPEDEFGWGLTLEGLLQGPNS
ncbi:hypothetical protein ACJIZ3_000810 [Penstemon smallii]|uniref:Uncharacterized protein n=1 Tax=Penstemon smallii TaxID=265156 RepID=A0ABD3U1Y2_9LAMI